MLPDHGTKYISTQETVRRFWEEDGGVMQHL
jgi:hypothetical protein